MRESDEWQPLFGPFQEVAEWLEELEPDRLVVIYNDHMDEFFLNAYPTFALGVAETYPIADEGFGARPFPPHRRRRRRSVGTSRARWWRTSSTSRSARSSRSTTA